MNAAILYSFRRCPYAMRARLAIAVCKLKVELREVVLADKPESLLALSAKATVPVLLSCEQTVIDESIDIMHWACEQNKHANSLHMLDAKQLHTSTQLIIANDGDFKYYLDRYKYADRYPEYSQLYYRQAAEKFLQLLEQQLKKHDYLHSDSLSFTDLAILPFIRQFSMVDKAWFDHAGAYPQLQQWLANFLASDLFAAIMAKYPQWKPDDSPIVFPI